MRRVSILVTTILLALSGVGFSPANAADDYDGTDGLVACVSEDGVTGAGSFRIVANEVTESIDCAGAAIIPDGVTSIRWGAFFGPLTSISIPKTVTSIEPYAFNYSNTVTSLSVDSLNPNFSSVDGVLFDKLATTLLAYPAAKVGSPYVVPTGVVTLSDYAFANALFLTAIDIPESVTSIGSNALVWMPVLAEIHVDSLNADFSTTDGVLFNKNKTTLLSYPGGKVGNPYVIPTGVTSIETLAFAGAGLLTSLTIPPGVLSIGWGAFQGAMALTSLSIPSTLTSIGDYAFENATSIASFNASPLNADFASRNGVLFSKDLTTLVAYPPLASNTSYNIPMGVITIATSAFNNATRLTSINIPTSVRTIGNSAFQNVSSITSLEIPIGVTSIGSSAFEFTTALTSITLPDTLTSIGTGAFWYASSLTSISIPASVTTIGQSAFGGDTSLTSVFFLGSSAPEMGDSAFGSLPSGSRVYVRDGASGFDAVTAAFNGVASSSGVHTVTYNSSGGTAVSNGVFAFGGPIATTPTSPKRTDYAFDGWSLQINGAAIKFPYTPSTANDITLYAKWKLDAAHTLAVKHTYAAKTLAKRVGVKVVSKNALVSIQVASASKRICVYTGSKLKTLKTGVCKVTFKVQEPKPKKGKKPKLTKSLTTFAVTAAK